MCITANLPGVTGSGGGLGVTPEKTKIIKINKNHTLKMSRGVIVDSADHINMRKILFLVA